MKKIPDELKPQDEDYVYYDKHYDLNPEDTEHYFQQAWIEYIEISVKSDFDTYIEEMKDEWRVEKENDGFVPPFKDWHEIVHDFMPTFNEYYGKNKAEIHSEFKGYLTDMCSPNDYFEDDEGGD